MGIIYQGVCTRCGHKTSWLGEGITGAVLVDRHASVSNEVAPHVMKVDEARERAIGGRVVVLGHPLEEYILAATGYTWNDILRQGRYVTITKMACRQCGNVFDRWKLAVPNAIGCVPTILLAIAAGVTIGFVRGSFLYGLIGGHLVLGGVMLTIDFMAKLYLQHRFAPRAAAIAANRACPACQSARLVRIDRAIAKVPCPNCQQRSLTFEGVAIS